MSASEHPMISETEFRSLKRARILFNAHTDPMSAFLPHHDVLKEGKLYQASLQRRKRFLLGDAVGKGDGSNSKSKKKSIINKQSSNARTLVVSTATDEDDNEAMAMDTSNTPNSNKNTALTSYNSFVKDNDTTKDSSTRILVKSQSNADTKVPKPTWHAPWKLSTVLSSHLGWVRSIAFDPANALFATGSVRSRYYCLLFVVVSYFGL